MLFIQEMLKKTEKMPNTGGGYPPRLQDWRGHIPCVRPCGAAYDTEDKQITWHEK